MPDFHLQHINISVANLDAVIDFYTEVIGLGLDPTPDQGFRGQFFRINDTQQIHMNEIDDDYAYRGHFCLEVEDFMGVFTRAKAAGVIDTEAWGRVRRLPRGTMQMFLRDPHGNLVEIASVLGAEIPAALFDDELVEPDPGLYKIPPETGVGGHHAVNA